MNAFLASFISLIYPRSCPVCGERSAPGTQDVVCASCWGSAKKHQPACFYKLGMDRFDRAYAAFSYEGVIKECVCLFKYKAKLSLARPLAESLIDFTRENIDIDKLDIIVPVPLHPAKHREREFNQSEVLARHLGNALGVHVCAGNLVKVKDTRPQVKLSGAQRLKNIKGAFEIKHANIIRGKNILLVDDVLTTGATVNECAAALKKSGAVRVEVLALAKGI